jgi:Raf kinase inhibitor-like YbhB/YbcL family protein
MTRAIALAALSLCACGQAGGFRFLDGGNDAAIGADGGASSDAVAQAFDATQGVDATPMPDAASDAGPSFVLTSTTIRPGQSFPRANTCFGIDTQPDLAWSGVPSGTESFAVILIDRRNDFVHWVAYDLPATIRGLPAGASNEHRMPPGTMEAHAYCNYYCGPCPMAGATNTYELGVYALDVPSVVFTATFPFGHAPVDMTFNPHTLAYASFTATSSAP